MIKDVIITSLLQFPDSRGTVKRFIRGTDVDRFSECYITTIYPGVIKGWHGYYTKTIHYCVPIGMVKLVLYDNRDESPTYKQIDEIFLGVDNYCRVSIPPRVFNAFQGIGFPMSMAIVVANEIFDEQKTIRIPIDNLMIPYDWTKINK